MRCSIPLIAIAAMAAYPLLAQEADEVPDTVNGLPLVLQGDFERDPGDWAMTDEDAWKIAEEEGNHVLSLHQQSDYNPPVRSPKNMARIAELELTDFVLEARMKQTGREYGHRDMCVFFGYQDPSHFYYVHMATKADAHAHSVFLVNDAPRVSVCDDRTEGIEWGTDYHRVRIVRDTEEGTVEVYFDDMDEAIMRAQDKTFLSGTVGFGSFDDTGNIDDVRIWAKVKE